MYRRGNPCSSRQAPPAGRSRRPACDRCIHRPRLPANPVRISSEAERQTKGELALGARRNDPRLETHSARVSRVAREDRQSEARMPIAGRREERDQAPPGR